MPIETSAMPRFMIKIASAQGMTRYDSCYTLEDLAHGGQNKDQGQRPMKAKLKNSGERYNQILFDPEGSGEDPNLDCFVCPFDEFVST